MSLALGAPLRTMYHLIDVVGSPTQFLLVAGVALVTAVGLARVLHPILAIVVGVVLFIMGLVWYITNLSTDPSFGVLVDDTVKLLTGRRLLQIANVRLWVTSFVSAPVFLTTYFALRRWYVTAVLVSGVTLGFFALTTDAGVVTTILGVVGSVAAVGFGRLDAVSNEQETLSGQPAAGDGIDTGRRSVLEQLAAIIVVPALLSRVLSFDGAALSVIDGGSQTVESSLVTAGESMAIEGSISLSPVHRFTVESEDAHYWRVATYDRYTGDGWVRTGESRAYDESELSNPPGLSDRVEQTFEVESAIGTVPAAWKPVEYDGETDIELTRHDGLQPTEELASGERYEVVSEIIEATEAELREVGDDYPNEIEAAYLQLPDSTPERVEETTDTLTEDAETPYEAALAIERWLQANREYSLEVSRPRRNVADRFLHAMNRGYCVYFATTMAVMLRTQDIPARLTVGYTSGEEVASNRWEVRGLHSHAWVELFVPDYGWVEFDPTPGDPRRAAEQQRLAESQSDADTGDQGETETDTPATETPTPTPTERQKPGRTRTPTATATPTSTEAPTTPAGQQPPNTGSGGSELPQLPSREETTLGLVALLGTAAGLRRAGVTERVSRALWLRYQRPKAPDKDVERAFQRVMCVLSQRHRPRESGETVRGYLDTIDADEDIRRLAALRERLRYSGSVSPEAAREAIDIADAVVAER